MTKILPAIMLFGSMLASSLYSQDMVRETIDSLGNYSKFDFGEHKSTIDLEIATRDSTKKTTTFFYDHEGDESVLGKKDVYHFKVFNASTDDFGIMRYSMNPSKELLIGNGRLVELENGRIIDEITDKKELELKLKEVYPCLDSIFSKELTSLVNYFENKLVTMSGYAAESSAIYAPTDFYPKENSLDVYQKRNLLPASLDEKVDDTHLEISEDKASFSINAYNASLDKSVLSLIEGELFYQEKDYNHNPALVTELNLNTKKKGYLANKLNNSISHVMKAFDGAYTSWIKKSENTLDNKAAKYKLTSL